MKMIWISKIIPKIMTSQIVKNLKIKEENLIINKNFYDKTPQKLGNYEKLEHKKIELIK